MSPLGRETGTVFPNFKRSRFVMSKRKSFAWALCTGLYVLLFLPVAQGAASEEYPFRVRYPDVSVISTDELAKRFNEVLVIDVRSKYEFETLHIKDAVSVPLGTGFGEAVAKLRAQHKKPFVFYCNGKTCHKSYDAVLLAVKARLDDLYAYDAGIFDWAKAKPEQTVLLGHSPIRSTELIDEKDFKTRLLEPKDFSARVGDKSIVLDVRDRAQRDTALFPFKEQRAQLSEMKKIETVIEQAKAQKKTLLVYDQTGKQVQWFQYYLENQGIKDYYFMKGGAQGHFDATLGKVVLGGEEKGKAPAGAGSSKQ
jgi:rhodanese-related sulfurtransferase